MSPITLWSETQGFGSGDTAVSLPGSGTAVPLGLEAVFSYNGLIFNDIDVIDKYRLISIEGLDDADVRDTREVKPARDGEDANFSLYGGRTIALRGRVEAYQLDKLRDMQLALRTAFADMQEQPLYFLTGDSAKDHFINCKKFTGNQWGEEQASDKNYFREFLVTVRASNPRFLSNVRTQTTLEAIPTSGIVSEEVINNGNYNALPEIKFVGPLDNFNVTNEATGQIIQMTVDNQIADGDSYTLNCDLNTIVDSNGVNVFDQVLPTTDTDFVVIPGSNTFRINTLASIATSDTRVEIKFRDSYI